MRTAIPKSNFKRIHHRQPKLYLGGFCEEPSFLWVYERGKPYNPGIQKRHKFNPCKLGVTELGEKDAYATVKADGKRDFEAIENRHQIIEHRADVVLRKIRAQSPISIAEKDIFAEYIQNMLWRTKKHEEDIRPRLDMIQKNGPSRKIALELAQAGQFTLSREHYDAIKYLESDGGKKDLILKSMVTRHPAIHQILNAMSWMFYIAASGTYFITSSAPVVFDPVGLLKSSLLFPVSKNIALVATHDGKTDLEYVNASLDETMAINYYTITQAQTIYGSREEYWIWDFLENGSRTDWITTLGTIMPFRTAG